ncbi:MAG: O-antigen ligase family protein [Planctomycetota bacterium]|nr:O-antigen ligase family protein [Planctomycetota bacterium]
MQLLVIIVALVALVWGAAFVLRGSLLTGCLVFLVVNACLGYYFFHVRVGPAELTLDRIVLVALCAMFAIAWRTGQLDAKPMVRMDYAVWAFFAWLAVRTFTSDFRDVPVDAPSPLWHLIVGYGSPLLLYGIARQLPLDRRAIGLVQKFFIAFGIYLALTGLAEVSGQWWAVFPKHISDPDVGLHFGRARGPMVQAVVYGFALSICLIFAWVYRLQAPRNLRTGLWISCAAFAAGIFFCYTRCVWIGAALAIGLLLWLTTSRQVRTVCLAALLLVGLLVVGTRWQQLQSFSGGRSAGASKDSAAMRVSFAYVSWQMFQDHPLLGCGFAQYVRDKNPYLSDRTTSLTLEHIRDEVHHNLFLSILVETGLIGFVLYVTMLAALAVAAWRLWSARQAPQWLRLHGLAMLAVLVAYVPNAIFQPMGHMNIAHMLFFFLGGLTSGLQHHVRATDRGRLPAAEFSARPACAAQA